MFVPMERSHVARWWFGATALAVFVGVGVQLPVSASADGGFFTEPWERVANTFAYFTVQSNLIVGITSLWLLLGRDDRATWFRVLRLLGVVNITLTFLVFHAVLRDLQDLTGQAAFADVLLHSVSPVLCVLGWVLFGPRGRLDRRVVALAPVYLLAWGAFTLVRGAVVGFYPYPFMNPDGKGYGRVTINLVIVTVVFVALCAAALAADRHLARRQRADAVAVVE